MNWSDDELRAALRRKDPPEEFVERVIARVELEQRERRFSRRVGELLRWPALRWALACAACLLLAISLVRYRQQRRVRAQAEIAGQQAMLALRITGMQIRQALDQAQEITRQTIGLPPKSNTRLEHL